MDASVAKNARDLRQDFAGQEANGADMVAEPHAGGSVDADAP
jgi:hypothetical protein